MNKIGLALICLIIVVCAGCSCNTVIKSIPEGARVIHPENGRLLGLTPYFYWDRAFSGTQTRFLLVADGYKPREVMIEKDVLYMHKIFLPPILGLPWIMGYEPEYLFELERKAHEERL